MASLDSLPADQRAVLELVLQRGRSYDEIGQMLAIDRAGVRQRALAAFDALGPQTRISPERRGLITDYLLGQLPARVSDDMRDRLARTPTERAWARVLASELAPVARDPLPEIPVEAPAGGAVESPVAVSAGGAQPGPSAPGEPRPDQTPGAAPRRPSSRVGGAVLLGLGAVVALAVVLVVLLTGGSDKKHAATSSTTATSTSAIASTTTTTATGTTSTAPTATTTGTTTTSTTPGHVVAQINLRPPSGGSAIGVAQVVRVGNVNGVVIVATGIPANTKRDAYAVWLSNSPSDSLRVGFVNPPVTTNGRLQTAGPLPSGAAKFKQLLLTLETQQRPTAPGKVVLQGALKLQ